ncbi:hypothetical protein [Cellulomonas massiliensis]|uniref:hypothetical protein n=1 Tax=Cellulomonas massiliensis TaxID=1465811 RepID=UPI0002E59BD6|nr:hypothetical protein [Cellulomonas massiliensis]
MRRTVRIPLPTAREIALAAALAAAAALPVVRTWHLQWGADEDELAATLPGDALQPAPALVATRAVTVRATPERVWPWLVQIGQGRGGFYSYDALENAFGCRIVSAGRVVARWQHLAPGDEVRLHPRVALRVVEAEPGRWIVLRSPDEGAPAFTWSFVLRPGRDRTTRVVVRERYAAPTPFVRAVLEPTAAASAVMTRGMLRGLRRRVEETA